MPAVPEHWNKCEVAHGHVKWLLEHAQLTTTEQVLVRSIDGTIHDLQSIITGLEERLSAALVRADRLEQEKQSNKILDGLKEAADGLAARVHRRRITDGQIEFGE